MGPPPPPHLRLHVAVHAPRHPIAHDAGAAVRVRIGDLPLQGTRIGGQRRIKAFSVFGAGGLVPDLHREPGLPRFSKPLKQGSDTALKHA